MITIILFQQIILIMALELGESFLENMIGLEDSNSSTDKVMNMIMVIII